MTKAEKRLEAMRNNPKGDWTIADVEAVCRIHGIACEPPARGSHYDLSHPAVPDILTIPFKRPIKPVYIRKLLTLIDRLPSDGASDDSAKVVSCDGGADSAEDAVDVRK